VNEIRRDKHLRARGNKRKSIARAIDEEILLNYSRRGTNRVE
jgi:predicted secreted acid phosphatase